MDPSIEASMYRPIKFGQTMMKSELGKQGNYSLKLEKIRLTNIPYPDAFTNLDALAQHTVQPTIHCF